METKKDGHKFAKIDYNKCIRCYCCQELCPFGIVKVKAGFIYKLVHLRDKK
jgi:formate hydrogenlyase subunit 6/NADH:ubiquinone oxidoreductase subunit I